MDQNKDPILSLLKQQLRVKRDAGRNGENIPEVNWRLIVSVVL